MTFQRSKNLNAKHKTIYDTVCKLRIATIYEVHRATNIKPVTVGNYMKLMVEHGLLESRKIKERSRYNYRPTDMTYEEFEKLFEKRVEESIPDPLLDMLENYELTDEQWEYVQKHKRMKRAKLAEKLGITRLQLTVGIDKRKNKIQGV